MTKQRLIMIICGAVLTLVGTFYIGRWSKDISPESKPVVIASPATPPPAPKPAVEKPKQPTLAELLDVATVKHFDGLESPFIRQLINDPTLVTEPKEKFKGDVTDHAAVKQWAGWEAHRLAIRFDKFDRKFGAWLYNYPDRVAYLLRKDADGHLMLAEYEKTPGQGFGVSPKPAVERQMASSISQAQFQGWPDNLRAHPLPAYEHLCTGDVFVE